MAKSPVSVISGATRGIGSYIRDELIRRGYSIVMIGSKDETVKHALQQVREGPNTLQENQFVKGIVINFKDWPHWLNAMKKQYMIKGAATESIVDTSIFAGMDKARYRVDLLVNCAGITQTRSGLKTSEQEMSDIMNVNFMSSVSLTQTVVRQMLRQRPRERSGPRGTIVNISSVLGDPSSGAVVPGTAMYSASKAAMIQYNAVLEQELRQLRIKVDTVTPGLVLGTDMTEQLSPEQLQTLQSATSATDGHTHRTETSAAQIIDHVMSILSRDI